MSSAQTLLDQKPYITGGRIIPDRFYTHREAAIMCGLKGPEYREFMTNAEIAPTVVKGREYWLGRDILIAQNVDVLNGLVIEVPA
ncbi:hypothetical protein GS610_08145 [Ruegeria sp. HKCCD6228]|uniref:hypothetical protein n=1 Tax=Ruegeria sp. HKCCD6228 TaxID=2683001 RepID=UPI0014928F11|nr:hypothetical protein [Ruegeria sp. HKCCD6228]NOD97178.1 hypothetical protein [Ruegeria sp. HKCCD6228]